MIKLFETFQLIDLVEDFVNSDEHNIIVGGMAGTSIFKHVIDAEMIRYSFNRILIIEGCQDYIGLVKTPMYNHFYYATLFVDQVYDSLIQYDPFKPVIFNPRPEYHKMISYDIISRYDSIVINDAHLIPHDYITSIIENFSGKICLIVDPFDLQIDDNLLCRNTTTIPTIVDSLNKLSPIITMARQTYEVGTRGIDTNIKNVISNCKINGRSIGKIDDKQYVTDDEELISIVREKQLKSQFRKSQKLLVTSDQNHSIYGHENDPLYTLTKNSIIIVDNIRNKPYMSFRLYNSNRTVQTDVSYDERLCTSGVLHVVPANIISLRTSIYHRYKHVVFISSNTLSRPEKYSLLKNTNMLTVCKI